jgi:hypothetical protein
LIAGACDWRSLRAARANRVFCTDEKRIRTKNAVMIEDKDEPGLLFRNIATLQPPRRPHHPATYM